VKENTPTIPPGCPFCGQAGAEIDEVNTGEFAVICQNSDCGAIGPIAILESVAINLWYQRFNRMDWPVTWLKMPYDPRAAGVKVTFE
jgi:hypothetical protein